MQKIMENKNWQDQFGLTNPLLILALFTAIVPHTVLFLFELSAITFYDFILVMFLDEEGEPRCILKSAGSGMFYCVFLGPEKKFNSFLAAVGVP